jgi:hypothetical protein
MSIDDPKMGDAEHALLAAVANSLDETAEYRRADAARAVRAAAALRGNAEPVGGEPARARLAHLVFRMLRRPETPTCPKWVARFVARASGYLDEAPLDLFRTVEGAERVRRLVELEPPLGRPDPDRVTAAAELDDLTAEEAFAAYAAGHIGSPRLMAITAIRSFGRIITALQDRGLQLPVRPSAVGGGRDDRDLLWTFEAGREEPSLTPEEPRGHRRPAPEPGPELETTWPTEVPGDADSRAALERVADELDAEAGSQHREAERAAAAALGLRGDAAAVGGEEARARLVDWALQLMRRSEGDHRAFLTALSLLQPLPHPEHAHPPEEGDGPLEMARTVEGAVLVERWLTSEGPALMHTGSGTPFPEGPAVDEAFTSYSEGRIDSQRLMEVTGIEAFYDLVIGLRMRGLALPTEPTIIGPGRDDRDMLWEVYVRPPHDETPDGTGQP